MRLSTLWKYSGVRGNDAKELLISARSSATLRHNLVAKTLRSSFGESADHHSIPSVGDFEAVMQ